MWGELIRIQRNSRGSLLGFLQYFRGAAEQWGVVGFRHGPDKRWERKQGQGLGLRVKLAPLLGIGNADG